MSCYTKEQLENMLEDVVNELELDPDVIFKLHLEDVPPAQLVKLVLWKKDFQIQLLRKQIKEIK